MNTWLDIPVENWLRGLALAGLTLLALLLLRGPLLRKAARRWELLDLILKRTRLYFILAAALYLGSLPLALPAAVAEVVYKGFLAAVFFQLGLWSAGLLEAFLRARQPAPAIPGGAANADSTTLGALGLLARIIIWATVGVLLLENISGVNATSLVTSLGITGIAVALAVQNILADLFAAVSIALDKPFVVGDALTVGDLTGTVEKIGLKSVRLRSVTGELLIFSNSDLLQSRLHNYTGLQRRRALLTLNLSYATPQDRLQAIPGMLQDLVSAQPQVTFDRAHFKAFGDFGLQFELVFFVESPDYRLYMDRLQAVNLAIYDQFAREGIQFARPLLPAARS